MNIRLKYTGTGLEMPEAGSVILKAGLFVLLLAAAAVAAQDTPVAADRESAQAQQETGREQVEEEIAEGVPEDFDPTEEISEDYSVEFPVDI